MASRIAATFARGRRGWRNHVAPRIAYCLSFLRNRNHLVTIWPDPEPKLGSKVALFVHFDRQGSVREYVRHYLAAVHAAGYDIAFVTNAGRLQKEAIEAISPLCAAILIRRNVGYDFGAMREGLLRLRLPRQNTEQLLLLNDSVYGPVRPIEEMLERIDFDVADFWGATESWQARYHLQSYFMAFGPAAMRSRAWQVFWERVRPVSSKAWVITRYEVGLTQRLIRAGLRARALWPYSELVTRVDPELLTDGGTDGLVSTDPIIAVRKRHARRVRDAAVERRPLNPTSDLWRQLLQSGFPFIKRELLRENPTGVSDVTDWRDVVTEFVGGDPAPIDRDLQRVLKNTAP